MGNLHLEIFGGWFQKRIQFQRDWSHLRLKIFLKARMLFHQMPLCNLSRREANVKGLQSQNYRGDLKFFPRFLDLICRFWMKRTTKNYLTWHRNSWGEGSLWVKQFHMVRQLKCFAITGRRLNLT
uniref:Uncharacterized protein n=1 Tax=Opuntia streptacantha TaxID=393608 RepID=A0A7C9AJV0_OPUST